MTAAGISRKAGEAGRCVTDMSEAEKKGEKPPKIDTANVYDTVIHVVRSLVGKISQIAAGPAPENTANMAPRQHWRKRTSSKLAPLDIT
jgi:hypothetical protein